MTTISAVTTSMKILVSKPDLVCCNSSFLFCFFKKIVVIIVENEKKYIVTI